MKFQHARQFFVMYSLQVLRLNHFEYHDPSMFHFYLATLRLELLQQWVIFTQQFYQFAVIPFSIGIAIFPSLFTMTPEREVLLR